MQVQINSDNTISMHTKLSDSIGAYINSLLQRFDPYLTRVEVHLTGENVKTSGPESPFPKTNAACSKPAPNVTPPSSSPTKPPTSMTPSPAPQPKCTASSKPPTAASPTSVAANTRWKAVSRPCKHVPLPNSKNLVKPHHDLTLYQTTTSTWRISYGQPAIINTGQQKKPRN